MVTPDALRGFALDAYKALVDPRGWPSVVAKLLESVGAPAGGIPHGVLPFDLDASLWQGNNPADSGISCDRAINPAVEPPITCR